MKTNRYPHTDKKQHFSPLPFRLIAIVFLVVSLWDQGISAAGTHALSPLTMPDFTASPLGLTDSVTPQVIINTSNDHQLFFKAYNDHSDLDDDGVAETTYKNDIDYYGYFDSYKCYAYSVANQRFEPQAATANKYCTGANDTYWSGNFLNWATMTRIDAIRKLLFGGHRRVDTSSSTVLERAYLPPDIHSFAKHYAGADVASLTPYTPNTAAPTGTSVTNIAIGIGNKTFTTQSGSWIQKGDFLSIVNTASSAKYMKGWVTAFNSATGSVTVEVTSVGGAGTLNSWNITNHTRTGITICNTTAHTVVGGPAANDMSQKVTDPPLIRVALGNYAFWSAGEGNQCLWENDDGNNVFRGGNGMNYNDPVLSEIPAAQDRPDKALVGVAPYGDFVARVQACVPGLLGEEKCKLYPYGNYKPIGLLQAYGDDDKLQFGMIAGTYGKPRSGGDIVAKIRNIDKIDGMCREINLGVDCDGDGNVDDDLVDATHAVGDGTFKMVYQSAGGPITNTTKSEGIINTWSLYRIFGYKYGDWNYNSNPPGDKCPLAVNFFGLQSDSECHNWGNPFSEIYLSSLRYYAGENSPVSYQSGDGSFIEGINYSPGVWRDPLSTANYCARLNVINFNSSVSSADTFYASDAGQDELDTSAFGVVKDLGATQTSKQLTDIIGQYEGIHGQSWFVGENGTDNNRRCTPKTVTSLGDVRGFCPEGPDLRGGYRVAGLAYYAHINDLRASGTKALTGTQKVDTFSVKLATGAPVIEIPVPGSATGQTVTLLPSCIDNNKSDYGCTMVDFKIVQPHSEVGGVGTGKFLVIWEDSLQGNDYDLDAGGIYEYSINSATISVSTAVTLENLGYKIGHGYVISGTTQDGLHIHSGTNGFNYIDPTGVTGCKAPPAVPFADQCWGAVDYDPVLRPSGGATTTVTYTIGAATAGLLQDPLWYAAKWGGFMDSNGNNRPDLQSEWDKEDNNTGDTTPDGIPDNYFYATNPLQLENALNRVFLNILKRVSSGTAAAVVSNNVRGEGALYQAYYEPQKKDASGRTATWIGTLHGLWLDSYGWMREDDGDRILEGYDVDKVVETYFDEVENKTKVRRWTSTTVDTFTPDTSTPIELHEVNYLWNTREQMYYNTLTSNGANQTPLETQRLWNIETADQGRFIKTWIDADRDGVVDLPGEYIDFTSSAITAANYGFFDLATHVQADALVTYLRGVETVGFRSRLVDYDSNGQTEVMRLGDIINSTPTLVGSPQEAFDLLYNDDSYSDFRALYQDRRNVLYVGANDGMMHAINAGFFDAGNNQFTTAGFKYDGTTPALEHPLGSEIWAYVPMNLLPHLKWLKDHNYSHVYYVDGKPRVFDAKIFNPDAEHPNGWGTMLVIGMRLGGGTMTIDTGTNGLGAPDNADDMSMRSAYVFFDITNPEAEPRLLAEIQLPDGSFTMVYPATITIKDKDWTCSAGSVVHSSQSACISACAAGVCTNTDPNKWYLIFGNGPDAIGTAVSSSTAKVYILDLAELTTPGITAASPPGCTIANPKYSATLSSSIDIIRCDTGVANMFLGNPISVDWELNYKADMVYVGLVGNAAANTGKMYRLPIREKDDSAQWDAPSLFVNTSQPGMSQATVGVDNLGKRWVYFGTGRLFVDADETSTAIQTIYGVKDPYNAATNLIGSPVTVAIDNNLINTTDVTVFTSGAITTANPQLAGKTTFKQLVDFMDESTTHGWYLNMPPIQGTAGVDPSTRVLSQPALLGGILFATAYQPNTDPCQSEGISGLYGLYYKTGTAFARAILGTETVGGEEASSRFITLGRGQATSPAVHSGAGSGDSTVNIFTQLSTGEIVRKESGTDDDVRSGMKSWRAF